MTEQVISYEAPQDRRGLTARDVFGIVVRTFGLTMALWGMYTFAYLVGVHAANAPTAGQSEVSFLIAAAFLLIGGLALLRGEWLVRFAYDGTAR